MERPKEFARGNCDARDVEERNATSERDAAARPELAAELKLLLL
jgi:hypothetical protein